MTIFEARSPSRFAERSLRGAGVLLTLAVLCFGLASPSAAGERCPIDFDSSPCLGKMIEKIRARGWVGIHLGTEGGGQWAITAIVPGSPAEEAGLRAGDRLVALEGVAYTKRRMNDLEKIYGSMLPGREVTYTVKRDGEKVDIQLTLASIPDHIVAEWVGRAVLESYGYQHGEMAPEAPKPPKPPKAPSRPDRPRRPGGGGTP